MLTGPIGFSLLIFFYNMNEYLKVPSGPLCWWTQDVLEFGHKLFGSKTLAEVPLLFLLFVISHIYLINNSNISHMKDNNINQQRFTVVPCGKSAHSAYWLFLIYFFII